VVVVARAVVVEPENDLVGLRGCYVPLEAVCAGGEVREDQIRRTAIGYRVSRCPVVCGRRAGRIVCHRKSGRADRGSAVVIRGRARVRCWEGVDTTAAAVVPVVGGERDGPVRSNGRSSSTDRENVLVGRLAADVGPLDRVALAGGQAADGQDGIAADDAREYRVKETRPLGYRGLFQSPRKSSAICTHLGQLESGFRGKVAEGV
jgi:hypothetical protein